MCGRWLTIFWRIRGNSCIDCSNFPTTKQHPAVILRLLRQTFQRSLQQFLMINISALLLITTGNCLRKERTQRGKECQSCFPQIFSISCPHPLPHLFSTAPRKSERKSTEQGGEKKKKENKWKQFIEEGRGEAKERHNSSLITAPSSHSVSGRKRWPCCFECVCHFLQQGHIFQLYYRSMFDRIWERRHLAKMHACFL